MFDKVIIGLSWSKVRFGSSPAPSDCKVFFYQQRIEKSMSTPCHGPVNTTVSLPKLSNSWTKNWNISAQSNPTWQWHTDGNDLYVYVFVFFLLQYVVGTNNIWPNLVCLIKVWLTPSRACCITQPVRHFNRPLEEGAELSLQYTKNTQAVNVGHVWHIVCHILYLTQQTGCRHLLRCLEKVLSNPQMYRGIEGAGRPVFQ